MKTTLKTSAAFVAALSFSLAGVVHAEGIAINLVGKSPQTVQAEIVKAAQTVCTKAIAEDALEHSYGSIDECVNQTVAAAKAKLAAANATHGFKVAEQSVSSR